MVKIIHYCWFGKGEKSDLINQCIKSWKVHFPDYEIKEWNEENFDVDSNIYIKQAYKNKKWAFVSDYVRLYALYTEGGIYFDTDVEVMNNFEKIIEKNKLIMGYHADNAVASATMISNKNNLILKYLLSYYDNAVFEKEDGSFDEKTNIDTITEMLVNKFNLILNNKTIEKENFKIYPKGYFTERDFNENNYTIHHFNASWVSKEEALKQVKAYRYNYNISLKWLESILTKTFNLDILKEKKICIYGNGSLGKLLVAYMIENNIKVKCIIDKVKNSDSVKGIKVINLTEIRNYEFDVVIVTPGYYFKTIKEEVEKICDTEIISIEDII